MPGPTRGGTIAQMFAERPPGPLRDRLRTALHQPLRGAVPLEANVTGRADLSGLGGRWFESPLGPGYVVESVYDASYCHGSIPLHRALSLDPERLAGQVRDPRIAGIAPEMFRYVDTETTGLGGAGTMVFLCGIARFEGAALHLRQYLLPAPDFEGGLLGGVAEALESGGALVSYNGKSFDVPALEARYILSRRRPTLRDLPHLDLLHPNRRLFRGVIGSHRLPAVERELLGFEREDDCPSDEVPARYFRFQRSGDPTHILPVLRHNAWDILSLVALAAHLAAVCDDPAAPLQAARAAEYAGDFAAAAAHYEAAIAAGLARATHIEAMMQAARAHARAANWEAAAGWWQALIDDPRTHRLSPYIELAKISEHRFRDPAGAYVLASEAAALAARGLIRPGTGECSVEAIGRRVDRLRRRLERAPAPV